jgi:DNA-binding response OmpR family regulator
MSQPLRILIVDDSANIRQVTRRYIAASFDIEAFEAGNGEDAEMTLQECLALDTPIDIVILDWMMPKMSGLEFLKKIRSTTLFSKSPSIIMLTAETYSEQINACMKYGVSVYLTKPFTQNELAEAIQKILTTGELAHAV